VRQRLGSSHGPPSAWGMSGFRWAVQTPLIGIVRQARRLPAERAWRKCAAFVACLAVFSSARIDPIRGDGHPPPGP
jgi:hypothetical protein